MKVFLIGGGGREHALAWQLAQSEKCQALYCAPGNPGIAECAECVPIGIDDLDALESFAEQKQVDLVVIGPEAPLVAGLADRLRAKNIAVFGPSAAAARLEGSKKFMKDLCAKYGVPTASYGSFDDLDAARAFIAAHPAPLVVKADGLAAGKGVVIAHTSAEAEAAAAEMLSGAGFGAAGQTVVIEEFLPGEELSFFAVADGKTYLALTTAQDHKRAFNGDTGPNTGGMGAYSPAHMMSPQLGREIEDKIIRPILDGMEAEGCPFSGVLYAGIMLVAGAPYLLEINVRFGDPECQPLMMRLDSDLLVLLTGCAQGELEEVARNVRWRDEVALCVVMAAKGYPGAYQSGSVIEGTGAADMMDGVKVFHAGTEKGPDGALRAAGGRVLGVTACGADFASAQLAAYAAIRKIKWPEGFYRRDIGWRAIAAAQGEEGRKSITC